jgi:hypothetical protein
LGARLYKRLNFFHAHVVRERFGAGVSDLGLTRVLFRFDYPFGPERLIGRPASASRLPSCALTGTLGRKIRRGLDRHHGVRGRTRHPTRNGIRRAKNPSVNAQRFCRWGWERGQTCNVLRLW